MCILTPSLTRSAVCGAYRSSIALLYVRQQGRSCCAGAFSRINWPLHGTAGSSARAMPKRPKEPATASNRNTTGVVKKDQGSSRGSTTSRAVYSQSRQYAAAAADTKLQRFYNLATEVFEKGSNPEAEAVVKLQAALGNIPLEELAIQEPLEELTPPETDSNGADGNHDEEDDCSAPRPAIAYQHIYDDDMVSLGIFCLPRGAMIPLHNHPGMTVLSRVLYGTMHVRSFDWADANNAAPDSAPTGARPAKLVMDGVLTAGDDPSVLHPEAGGNIHQFTALSSCAVLDLLAPPYAAEEGRDCTYYSEHQEPDCELIELEEVEPPTDFVVDAAHYSGVTLTCKVTRPKQRV